ncbi:MAG TPA: hypothetical protein DCS67_03720 [Clostridiales bacterium UBA8960]|nr:hypothetical protein [Clostridiales bacterium UBA8960]
MNVVEDIHEIVMVCDRFGIIEEISFPLVNVSDYFEVGQSFLNRVDSQSMSKALTFMLELNNNKVASNHEVNFAVNDIIKRIYFSGYSKDNQFVIIATTRADSFNHFHEELMKINSEQVNQFRLMLKSKLREQESQTKATMNYFDEISKLNNELLNSQRELAKKNQELNLLNGELERLATRDPLTGLYNRRLLFEKFFEEKRRAERLSYALALAVIDINHFKKVNDQLGHAAGDELLIRFSSLMLGMIRESLDFAFRIGGDEFLILFANCNAVQGEAILERLNMEFAKLSDIASLAYGVIEIDKDCDVDLDRCIMTADSLMFVNKQGSR